MGAIQGAIDNLVSTATAAAAVGKHFKEQEESKALQKGMMEEQRTDTKAQIAELSEKESLLKDELKVFKEGGMFDADGNAVKNAFGQDVSMDIRKRKLALRTVREKIQAKALQVEAYNRLLGGKK